MRPSDLEHLSVAQADALVEIQEWVADRAEWAEEDRRAADGMAAFFA